ncbi:MAG: tetratricopeptide repeat protein [Candidatus Diapherotrites archaeon]
MAGNGICRAAAVIVIFFALAAPVHASYDKGRYNTDVDYLALHLAEIDKDGFTKYSDEYASFRWRNLAFLPEKIPVMGLGPLASDALVVMELKDINGTVFMHTFINFDGMEKYPIIEGADYFEGDPKALGLFRKVDDANELTIWREHPVISIFGNSMFDPPSGVPFRVNNSGAFGNISIFVPKNLAMLDYYSNQYIFKTNENSVFAYHYNVTSVVYADLGFKLAIQIALGLITMLVVFTILWLYKYIPQFNIRPKHFVLAMLACGLLMAQLAFLIPNPNALNIDWWLKPQYGEEVVPFYLRFILGMTDSADGIFIHSFSWNENEPFSKDRGTFLLMKSAGKIYILEGLEDSRGTVQLIKENAGAEKVELISEAQLQEKKQEMSRAYPWDFLFQYVRAPIYFLFLIISFAATAFIITLAFEIKGVRALVAAAVILFVTPFALQFLNILAGFQAHLPVTYHGASTLPLTMSSRSIPFLEQAHSVRAVLLMLGVGFAFIFVRAVRRRISIRAFLVPILIFALLLTLPQTEFSAKRTIGAFACGDCGINYRGQLDWLNTINLYSAVRANSDLSALFEESSQDMLNKARGLRLQGKYPEAIEAFEEILYSRPIDRDLIPPLIELADLSSYTGDYGKAITALQIALDTGPDQSEKGNILLGLGTVYERQGGAENFKKAMDIYTECIGSVGVEDYVVVCMFRRAEKYGQNGEFANAVKDYKEIVEKYPEHRMAPTARQRLEGLMGAKK